MYNELARLQDASAPDAEMAELPDYPEVAMAVYGTINNQHSTILETVERMTKQVEVDTMLKNARRDNVEWAWVPNWAETYVFCITIASQRWMPTACASLQFARNFYEREKSVKWAESYYHEILKKSTDTDKLSDGTGFRKELIDEVKKYTIEKHLYIEDSVFEYDPLVALSWQRLAEGKIEKRDITLLEHEYYEMTMKKIHPEWNHIKVYKVSAK